ncbi:uncharacterized protein LOC134422367 [Melospiza melodia melodia]|uniref:uncharacterized protein LOC134422367 n=1 Tax=Melospiza melodia melodia TaxID=1914991 RepID=UPI002FCF481E
MQDWKLLAEYLLSAFGGLDGSVHALTTTQLLKENKDCDKSFTQSLTLHWDYPEIRLLQHFPFHELRGTRTDGTVPQLWGWATWGATGVLCPCNSYNIKSQGTFWIFKQEKENTCEQSGTLTLFKISRVFSGIPVRKLHYVKMKRGGFSSQILFPYEAIAQVYFCSGKNTTKMISWVSQLFSFLQNMVDWTWGGHAVLQTEFNSAATEAVTCQNESYFCGWNKRKAIEISWKTVWMLLQLRG